MTELSNEQVEQKYTPEYLRRMALCVEFADEKAGNDDIRAALRFCAALLAEVKRLREIEIRYLTSIAWSETIGIRQRWREVPNDAADDLPGSVKRLVELGEWERHPIDEKLYRPFEQAARDAAEGGEA